MTEKELRKLKRSELLEMMIAQSKEIAALQAQLRAANEKLEERELRLQEAGSIAQAALALNHIFEDAQAAADLYLENVRRLSKQEGPDASDG
ncbi:MAG: DNA repair protein [Eubacteriales bacterium]|nr:DNA repair protein [Eubacteriales bacterium]